MFNRDHFAGLLLAILAGILVYPAHGAAQVITQGRIAALVTEHFGAKVRHDVSSGEDKSMPRFMRVSLAAKLLPVFLVPIDIDPAKGTLNTRRIEVITRDGSKISPDDAVGGNCLALAFFHGLPTKQEEDVRPSAVYMLYDCFSGYTRVAKGARMLRDARVRAEGEAVLLDLETGAQLLVYWSAGRYRTKLVRMGC